MSNNTTKKQNKKMGLGRGLNSLLGSQSFDDDNDDRVEKAKDTLRSEALAKELLPPINKKPTLKTPNKARIISRPESAQPINKSKDFPNKSSEAKIIETKEKVPTQAIPVEAKVPDNMRIWNVRIDKVKGNKEQPRKIFSEEQLSSLSASIKEKGILQPITVRRKEDESFEIIAGERRWRAAQLAGLQEVPVIIKEVDDSTSLELALIENIQRENLNPIEEAEAYFYLIKKYKMTQQELAEKIGKERATVANVLRLLNLSPEVRKMVAASELSLGQAKALMGLSDPKKQKSVAIKARDAQMSVRAVEKLVAKYKEGKPTQSSHEDTLKDQSLKDLKSELQRLIGTKVSIDYNLGKGKISISYYGDDELNEIVDKIRSAWKK